MSLRKTAKVVEVESVFNVSIEDLLEGWHEERLSHRDIAAEISAKCPKVSHMTVGDWLKKAGLKRKVISEGGKTKKMRALEKSLGCEDVRKELQCLYYQEGLSYLKISDVTNGLITPDNICHWFQKWNLVARSPFQGMSEKQRKIWRYRKIVLHDCQQRMDQNPSSQLTISPEEEKILVGLAKGRHKQARQLLICANLHHAENLTQSYVAKLPGWAREYWFGEFMSAGYLKLVEIVNNIGAFEERSRFSSFAWVAIRNGIVEVIRRSVTREKYEQLIDPTASCVGSLPSEEDPEEDIVGQIFFEQFVKTLNELPQKKRDIFLSRAIDESTFTEIADGLGMSYEATRSAYRRLTAKLRNDSNIKGLKTP